MAAKSKPTLLRGTDGEMYFIPPEELSRFRVPDDKAREVEEKLGGDEVSGFSFDGGLSPGDLGFDNPAAPSMDNSETVVTSDTQFPQETY